MNENYLSLFEAVSGKFDVGTYEEFLSKMQTPEDRKSFYEAVSLKGFDLGDYNEYELRLKKKDSSKSASPIVQDATSSSGTPQSNGGSVSLSPEKYKEFESIYGEDAPWDFSSEFSYDEFKLYDDIRRGRSAKPTEEKKAAAPVANLNKPKRNYLFGESDGTWSIRNSEGKTVESGFQDASDAKAKIMKEATTIPSSYGKDFDEFILEQEAKNEKIRGTRKALQEKGIFDVPDSEAPYIQELIQREMLVSKDEAASILDRLKIVSEDPFKDPEFDAISSTLSDLILKAHSGTPEEKLTAKNKLIEMEQSGEMVAQYNSIADRNALPRVESIADIIDVAMKEESYQSSERIIKAYKDSYFEEGVKYQQEHGSVANTMNKFWNSLQSGSLGFTAALQEFQEAVGREMFTDVPVTTPLVMGQSLKSEAERYNELNRGIRTASYLESGISYEDAQKTFSELFLEGKGSIAKSKAAIDIGEQIPQMALQVGATLTGGGIAGKVGIEAASVLTAGMFSTQAMGGAYLDIDANQNLTTGEKFMYAVSIGAANYFIERAPIFRSTEEGLSRFIFGDNAAVSNAIKKSPVLKQIFSKTEEGWEEALTSIVEQGFTFAADYADASRNIDALQNKYAQAQSKEEREAIMTELVAAESGRDQLQFMNLYQISDAFIMGTALGAGTQGSTYLAAKGAGSLGSVFTLKERSQIVSKQKELFNLLHKESDPAKKQQIKEQIAALSESFHRLELKDSAIYGSMTDDEVRDIVNYNHEISAIRESSRALRAKLESAENSPEATQAFKQQIDENKKAVEAILTRKKAIEDKYIKASEGFDNKAFDEQEIRIIKEISSYDPNITEYKTEGYSGGRANVNAGNVDTVINGIISSGVVKSTAFSTAEAITKGLRNVQAMVKSMAKSNPNMKVVLHGTQDSFMKATESDSIARGMHINKSSDGLPSEIHLYVPALKANTAYHEAYHEETMKQLGSDGIATMAGMLSESQFGEVIGNDLLSFVKRSVKGKANQLKAEGNEAEASKLMALANKATTIKELIDGDSTGTAGDEFLIELLAMLESGEISISLKTGLIAKLKQFVAEAFTPSGVGTPKINDVINAVKSAVGSMNRGEATQFGSEFKGTSTSKNDTIEGSENTAKNQVLFNEPIPELTDIANKYNADNGLPKIQFTPIRQLDVEKAKAIADVYEASTDASTDPEVIAAYEAMALETKAQYEYLKRAGYNVEVYGENAEPYASSTEMIADLRVNKKIFIYSTESGFGTEPISQQMRDTNPLLRDSGIVDSKGTPLLMNDLFRFVHDVFGHAKHGNSFGAIGEENAWAVHSQMYSPQARRVMTSETRGQNSWVNSGKHLRREDGSLPKQGDADFIPPKDRPFADQKNFLFPDEYVFDNYFLKGKSQAIVEGSEQARVEQSFTKAFSNKGIPQEQIAAALALLAARANSWASEDRNRVADDYYATIDIGNGEFSEGSIRQFQLPDGSNVTGATVSPEVVNGFYSPIEKKLLETKAVNLSATKWLQLFGKGDEMTYTGLKAWLESKRPDEQVKKADIQSFLKENRIEIVEVIKGGDISEEEIDTLLNDEAGEGMTREEAREYLRNDEDNSQTKFAAYQVEGEKSSYKEVLVTMPNKNIKAVSNYNVIVNEEKAFLDKLDGIPTDKQREEHKDILDRKAKAKELLPEDSYIGNHGFAGTNEKEFKSFHFNEPNILVHLRMNTRTAADGSKVLFLEEVQSDWGQTGRDKGFKTEIKPEDIIILSDERQYYDDEQSGYRHQVKFKIKGITNEDSVSYYPNLTSKDELIKDIAEQYSKNIGIPTAPFVTDTNAWTKLGLKVALKEAVSQGADKIAWTTGEQQNDRYDLSKQIESVVVIGAEQNDNINKRVTLIPNSGKTINMTVAPDGKVLSGDYSGNSLDDVIGKELAEKVVNSPNDRRTTLSGNDLKIGGKGMKGFYGSPTEGSLGIVGGVAKSLFKQEPKTVTLKISDSETNYTWTEDFDGLNFVEYNGVTKEFKTEKEAQKYVDELKSRQSTQHSIDVTPELKAEVEKGLPLFQKDKSGVARGAVESLADGRTIIHAISSPDFSTMVHELAHVFEKDLTKEEQETVKKNGGSEAFATGFERYLRDGVSPVKELASLFEKFKQWMTDIYKSLKGTPIENTVSPEIKAIFDRLLSVRLAPNGLSNVANTQSQEAAVKLIKYKADNGSASTNGKAQDDLTILMSELMDKYEPNPDVYIYNKGISIDRRVRQYIAIEMSKKDIIDLLTRVGYTKDQATDIYKRAKAYKEGRRAGKKAANDYAKKTIGKELKLKTTEAKNLKLDLQELSIKVKTYTEFIDKAIELVNDRMLKRGNPPFSRPQIERMFKIMRLASKRSAEVVANEGVLAFQPFIDKLSTIFDQQDAKLAMEEFLKKVKQSENLQTKLKNRAKASPKRGKAAKNIQSYLEAINEIMDINPALMPDIDDFLLTLAKIESSISKSKVVRDSESGELIAEIPSMFTASNLLAMAENFKSIEALVQDSINVEKAKRAAKRNKTTFEEEYDKIAQSEQRALLTTTRKALEDKQKEWNTANPNDMRSLENWEDVEFLYELIAKDRADLAEMKKEVVINEIIIPFVQNNILALSEDRNIRNILNVSEGDTTIDKDDLFERLSRLSQIELLQIDYRLRDYYVNGTDYGLGYVAAVVKAKADAAFDISQNVKQGVRARSSALLRGTAFLDTLESFFRLTFAGVSKDKMIELRRLLGVSGMTSSFSLADSIHAQDVEDIQAEIKRIESQVYNGRKGSVRRAEDRAIMQLFSMARQFNVPDGVSVEDAKAEWFLALKNIAERSLEEELKRENTYSNSEKEQLRNAIDFVFGGEQSLDSLIENVEQNSPDLVEFVDFMVRKHQEKAPLFSNYVRQFLGQELEWVNNYTAFDIRQRTASSMINEEMDLVKLKAQVMARSSLNQVKKVAGSSFARNPKSIFGENNLIGLDFIAANESTMRENTILSNTIESTIYAAKVFNSEEVRQLIPSEGVRRALAEKLVSYSGRHRTVNPAILRKEVIIAGYRVANPMTALKQLAAIKAFGSLFIQTPKQIMVVLSAVMNTENKMPALLNLMSTITEMTLFSVKTGFLQDSKLAVGEGKYELLQNSSVFMRDYETAMINPYTGSLIVKESLGTRILDKTANISLKNLKGTDKIAAVSSWFMFYGDYLISQGKVTGYDAINWIEEATSPDIDALAYADSLVSKDQAASSPREAVQVYSLDGNDFQKLVGFVLNSVVFPFSRFALNKKRSISYSFLKMAHGNAKAKKEGAFETMGNIIELTAFAAVSKALLPMLAAVVADSLFDDEEEENRNTKKEDKKKVYDILGQVVKDMNPAPTFLVSGVEDQQMKLLNKLMFMSLYQDDWGRAEGDDFSDKFDRWQQAGNGFPTFFKKDDERVTYMILKIMGAQGALPLDLANSIENASGNKNKIRTISGKEYFVRPEDQDKVRLMYTAKSLIHIAQIGGLSFKEFDMIAKYIDDMPTDRKLTSEEEYLGYSAMAYELLSEKAQINQAIAALGMRGAYEAFDKSQQELAVYDEPKLQGRSAKFKSGQETAAVEAIIKEEFPTEYGKYISVARSIFAGSQSAEDRYYAMINYANELDNRKEADKFLEFTKTYLGMRSEKGLESVEYYINQRGDE
jgi:hypothetical protein